MHEMETSINRWRCCRRRSPTRPNDDDLIEGLLDAYLLEGKFQAAQDIIDHHTFGPRHRTYRLRDEYRELEYGKGSEAFNKGDYKQALSCFRPR